MIVSSVARHHLMHFFGIVPLNKIRGVAVAPEELVQLLMADAGQHTGVGDLVAVQMQNGEHDAVGEWVEKLVRVPRRGQRTGFRLPVSDDAGDDQVGIVYAAP